MRLLDYEIECNGRSDRFELFLLWDIHFGKSNCNEVSLKKWITEVVKRDKMEDRHARILLGGDVCNAINPKDIKRFDFSDIADWLLKGKPERVKDNLSNMTKLEADRASKILKPVRHLIIGALEGNHEKTIRKRFNYDIQLELCEKLGVPNLSDCALIRFRFRRSSGAVSSIIVVARHGYGGGRGKAAEVLKLAAMQDEWEMADVCISGHTHTFCPAAPKAVAWVPAKGDMPGELLWKHRFALNPGCWLDSHAIGRGTYESNGCYPARSMMTAKVVVWPFYRQIINGRDFTNPKIEVRSYPIL